MLPTIEQSPGEGYGIIENLLLQDNTESSIILEQN
jgi:hypothetical protein